LRPINIEAERWFVSGARLDLSILERAPCRIRVPDSSEMLKSLRPSIIRTLGGDCRLTAVLRGSALVMAIQVLGIALTYSMQVVIARCAGPFEFGVFAYAWTWMNVLFLVAAFGMNESALRLMPSYSARSEWPLCAASSSADRLWSSASPASPVSRRSVRCCYSAIGSASTTGCRFC
jgi:hypothetical protein